MTIRPSWPLYRRSLLSPRGAVAAVVVVAMLVLVLVGAGPAGPYLAISIVGILLIAVFRGLQLFRRAQVTLSGGRLGHVNASARAEEIDASNVVRAVRLRRGRAARTLLLTEGGDVFVGFDHRVWDEAEIDSLVAALGLEVVPA